MAATYRIETLGCKANLYDSQRLSEALERIGYVPAAGEQPADVCILNSCTVTSGADRKSRQLARRLARESPAGQVFVTGCYATAAPRELEQVKGVQGVYGRYEWQGMLEAVHGGPLPDIERLNGDFGIDGWSGRTRAYLKIQEGCDACCAYCILPHVRGKPRSRPLKDVRREAERLVARGFREIVLTGIHLGFYGRGLREDTSLADAVRAVAETPGLERLRLSSVEPNEVDEALLAAMQHPAVCPHLHLPLQSGDADVLRRMNRRYSSSEFRAAVALARQWLDRPAITTDVMVGFPGESKAQFENTLDLCKEVRFSRIHVFPFSPRAGTPAATMPGQIAPEATATRSEELRTCAERLAEEWAESFVNRTVRVLWERQDEEGELHGYTDRYVRVRAPGSESLVGCVEEIPIVGRCGDTLVSRKRV